MSVWTDEKVEILRDGVARGFSRRRIAEMLGVGFSRNAVIGKATRLKLGVVRVAKPRVVSKPAPGKTIVFGKVKVAKITPQLPIPVPKPSCAEIVPFRVPLVDLLIDNCRFPLGDPVHDDDFAFCGAPALAGRPYCVGHCKIAYQARPAR